MKNLKFLLCLIIAISLAFISSCKKQTEDGGDGTTGGGGQNNIRYSSGLNLELTSDGTAYTVAGVGSCVDVEIVIPESYQNKPIISVKSCAFYNNLQVQTVTFSSTVKVLEDYAFSGCENLRSVMYLGTSSLERIGNYAFSGCNKMQFFNFASSIKYVGEYAFSYCSALNSVTFNSGSKLEVISAYAFKDCYILTGVRVPKTVKTIDKTAFDGCKNLIMSF